MPKALITGITGQDGSYLAELPLFHPTEKSKYLNMMVAPGQTFPSHQAKLYVEVNSRGVDSLSLNGYQRLKVRLPGNLQAENVIRLHLDRTAKPTEEDPGILSFRVFRAFLSEN